MSNKVAAITGGTRGIGRGIAEALVAEGWTVSVTGRNEDSLREVTEQLGCEGERVDVQDEGAVDSWLQRLAGRHGRLDLLVNNAGVGRFAPVDEMSADDWRAVVHTNLDGAFYALSSAARLMKPREDGWIVNIASIASRNAIKGGAAYNASKFGMLGLAEAAMLDLRKYGIRVTTVMPGSVDTDFAHRAGDTDWMLRSEDVAQVVLDLLRYPARALPSRIEIRPTKPPSA
ncbi:MAG: SDR family oxidoreductase [Acidobacteriota bacterium]